MWASGLQKRCIFEGCEPVLECGFGIPIAAPLDIPNGSSAVLFPFFLV